MERINVEAILKRHHFTSMSILNEVFTTDDRPGSEGERLKAAIKEIVELAIDKCKDAVKPEMNSVAVGEYVLSVPKVDMKPLEQVKKLIDYE